MNVAVIAAVEPERFVMLYEMFALGDASTFAPNKAGLRMNDSEPYELSNCKSQMMPF